MSTPAILDEPQALELDRRDTLAGFRSRFCVPLSPRLEPVAYFCGNSLGLASDRALRRVEVELERWRNLGVDGHFSGEWPWYSYHESVRDPLARLVGARPIEVVAMNSLTVNLHLLLVSFFRPAGKRSKILMEDCAFPSDTYAVHSQLAWHGIDPDHGCLIARPRPGESALRTEDLEAMLDRHGDEIALVLLGAVNYFTGQLFDVARIAAAARRAGALVGLDLAHAVGNVPLALHDWNVDFAVWCSYKYLNGGPGAVAGAFVHERHADAVQLQRLAGWWGNDPQRRFRMHLEPRFRPARGADGWQISNPPILALAPIVASLALFEEAGSQRLREKSIALTGALEATVDAVGAGKVEILTPRDPMARGCQLSLRVAADGRELARRFLDDGITVDFREPDVVRAAPVPLYNSFHDLWRLGRSLADWACRTGDTT